MILDTKHKWILFTVWMTLQAILLSIFHDVSQFNDTIGAIANATYCYENKVLSPNTSNIWDIYIQAPGFTNYLTLIYFVFGTFKAAQWIALLMNGAIILELYWLTNRLYNQRVAIIAAILYGTILSNIFASIYILSEIPFLFLSLSGLCLVIKGNVKNLSSGGLLFALAYTIKPLVLAFLLPSFVLLFLRKRKLTHYIALLLPFILSLQIYATYNEKTMGYRVTTSTTGGFNLCMSTTSPHPNFSVFKDSTHCGYIPNNSKYTFVQKDSIRTHQAIGYIMQHPIDYLKVCLKKPFWLFFMDTWSVPPLVKIDDYQYAAKADNPQHAHRVLYIIRCVWSIPYYIVCILFIFALFKRKNDLLSERGIMLLVALLGIGATCIFTVEERYKYPYMFVFAMWAASLFENKIFPKNYQRIKES